MASAAIVIIVITIFYFFFFIKEVREGSTILLGDSCGQGVEVIPPGSNKGLRMPCVHSVWNERDRQSDWST